MPPAAPSAVVAIMILRSCQTERRTVLMSTRGRSPGASVAGAAVAWASSRLSVNHCTSLSPMPLRARRCLAVPLVPFEAFLPIVGCAAERVASRAPDWPVGPSAADRRLSRGELAAEAPATRGFCARAEPRVSSATKSSNDARGTGRFSSSMLNMTDPAAAETANSE
ncbi:hypothetical protein D9M72_392880 [compost metagenome]